MKEAADFPPVTTDSIFFSNATYQIGVRSAVPGEAIQWPFIHLGEKGELVDGFCSCSEEDVAGCAHLAKAYMVAIGSRVEPLHKCFENAFFKELGFTWFRLAESAPFSYEKGVLKLGALVIRAEQKRELKFLEEIVEKSGEATEETSLKFSNLSEEEIASFRRGRPSERLAFELSLWADLAKWLFIKEELDELIKVDMTYDNTGFPKVASLHFKGLFVETPISKEEIGIWIDHLEKLPSPLFVKNLSHITRAYLKDRALILERGAKGASLEKKDLVEGPSYLYLPKKGFYKTAAPKEVIESGALEDFLEHRRKEIEPFIPVHPEAKECRHSLYFDEKNQLHIRPYLFEEEDMIKEGSFILERWAYIVGKGFFAIQPPLFGGERIVRAENVAEFLMDQRFWLQDFPGFAVHLFQLDTEWTFEMEGSRLRFFQAFVEAPRETIDLGEWVYVRGEGFFQKKGSSFYHALTKKSCIEKDEISTFIEKNSDDLIAIPGFFSSISPVEKRALKVSLERDLSITTLPVLKLIDGVEEKDLIFFGSYVYWKNRGFSALYDSALPFGFEKKKEIPPSRTHRFLNTEFARLRPFILELSPQLEKVRDFRFALVSFSSGKGARPWKADLEMIAEDWKLNLAPLALAKAEGRELFFSDHGYFDLADERFEWLALLGKGSIHGNSFRLTTLEMLRLMAYEFETDLLDGPSQKVYSALIELRVRKSPNLEGLRSDLRSYQKVGLDWLWSLHEYGLGALLCDDMGLGKTHQAMALLAAISNKKRGRSASAIVVCPTSVIYHWQDQLKRFLPNLRVYVYHGSARNIDDYKQSADILLTSYGILRRGDKHLKKLRFDLAIFDEMQIAKNYHSQTHEALKKLKASMIVGLSGTPLENDLEELRALFNLILPTYLPDEAHFRKFFAGPIEKMHDRARRDLLRRLIQPFILRRRKSEVLKDLPKKIEQNAFTYMEDEQHALYVQTAEHYHSQLRRHIQGSQNTSIPFTSVLALLTKLKMICSHPALFLDDIEGYKKYPCGKWRLFCELLREAMSSEQKVVVFTQYLGMIDILKQHLRENQISFASIQGATVNRQKELENFANDPTCKVFVGSLRAVGLGVNLSSGSCVIHYDRWWNPAWENQATDRVHRIGQRRGVQVFKLITKNSIEEKIDEIIQRKTRLLDIVDFEEGEDILGTFTKEDWMELVNTLKTSHRDSS